MVDQISVRKVIILATETTGLLVYFQATSAEYRPRITNHQESTSVNGIKSHPWRAPSFAETAFLPHPFLGGITFSSNPQGRNVVIVCTYRSGQAVDEIP